MSDQQGRDHVRRMLDATARDGIADDFDVRLDVLRVIAQRRRPDAQRIVHLNGHDDEFGEDDDESLGRLGALLREPPVISPLPERWPAPRRQSWPRELLKLAAAALVIGLIAAVLALTFRGDQAPQVGAPATPGWRVLTTLPVGADVRATAVGDGSIWLARAEEGTVIRIDAATGQAVATIRVADPGPESVGDIAVGAGAVWVTSGPTTLIRIDPATNEMSATYDLPARIFAIGADAAVVWAAFNHLHQVVRVDPATGAVVATIDIPTPVGFQFADGAVWVASGVPYAVRKIDPLTNTVVATAEFTFLVWDMLADGDSLWVTTAETIHQVDLATGRIVSQTFLPAEWRSQAGQLWGGAFAILGDGALWTTPVAAEGEPPTEVRKFDLVTRQWVGTWPTSGLALIAFADSSLWGLTADGALVRVAPES